MIENEEKFDWVKERAECSIDAMFARLKAEIDTDIKSRVALLPEKPTFSFALETTDDRNKFIVARLSHVQPLNRVVTFERKGDDIEVRDDDDKVFLKASLTLNNEGECRFKVKDRELQSWQLRKEALETIFFVIERRK